MPAVSKKQQKFFGIVRAIQKGEMAPTTPETAKAAADMKKGDVKKFASTKHKGLPEKKKIEEDRQINKIIKQLRKSVKSHKKQADTLEKKVKTFKESNFSNITVGNKVGQTFQHVTGATITLDGALGGKMMVPSQVTIEVPGEFGEGGFPITVDGPSESDFGLAGFTKPLDIKLQKRIADQSVAQINNRLDASRGLSGAETARVSGIPSRQDGFGGGQGNRTNRRGSAFNKDGSVNLGAKGDMTYNDVIDAINAISDKYNKKRDPLYAAIREYRAGTEAADKIDAYNRAAEKEEKAVYDAWDEYNKNYDPTIKIGKVTRGVYDLSKTYNDTGSPDITQPDTSGSENTYSAGYEDPRSEAEAKAGYNKGIGNLSGFPSWDDLSSDLELPDTPEPPSIPPSMDPNNFDDDGNFNPPDEEPGWTYDEYMKQYAALQDAAGKRADPIVKEKLRYGPTGYKGVFKSFINRFGQKAIPMWIIDAEEAITNALTKALGALSDRWEAYNKAFQPPDGSSGPQPKSPPSTDGIENTPIWAASNPYGTPPGGLDDEDKGDEEKGDEEKDDEEKDDEGGTFDDDGNYVPPKSDTEGEFMPSNPKGMRQQGVGKSAKDLSRHSPGTSAQQPKTKGGQGGRRLGSTTSRQGGAYGPRNPYGSGIVNTNTPTGMERAVAGLADAITGNLTDFDRRGGAPNPLMSTLSNVVRGTARTVAGTADALTNNRTDFDRMGGEPRQRPGTQTKSRRSNYTPQEISQNRQNVKNTVNAVVKSVWDGTASKSISQNNKNQSKPERLKRFFTGVADLYVNTGLRITQGPFANISNQLVDFDKRGTLGQGLMIAGTKIPGADKYATAVNHMLSLDQFLKDFSGKNNVKGTTPENPLDTTGSISKNDMNFLEKGMTNSDLGSSLETLSKSDSTSSEIDAAKSDLENGFFDVYRERAGLVATFGGTGDPVTGEDKALPRVLDVRDRGNYYEVDFGKSYAFRPGGSEPDVPFIMGTVFKAFGVEPDTIGSDTLSTLGAPIAAKFGIVNDEKFRKKGDPYNLYNSPDMYYKVRIKVYKKKKKKVNESKLSFKLIQQFREESNPRIPRKKGQPANSKKHSDLYTDENPKGTIHGLGFKDVATSKASVSKIRNSSRSHAHKIQAAVAMEQRAREMGKTSEAAVYRKYINSMKKKTKKMNEAANPAQQAAIAISMKKKGIKPKNLKEQIKFAQMQQRIRDAKEKRREQQKKSEKLYIDTKRKGVKFYDKKGSGRLKDGKKIYD